MEKHKLPLRCKIRGFFSFSPSAIWVRCSYGLMRKCRRCPGCEHNIREIMREGFKKGLEEGLKND